MGHLGAWAMSVDEADSVDEAETGRKETTMKLKKIAGTATLAGAMGIAALGLGTGSAQAKPHVPGPPVPPIPVIPVDVVPGHVPPGQSLAALHEAPVRVPTEQIPVRNAPCCA